MASRKPTPPPKKASGTNVEEWQRSGCKVQFRLTEREAKELRYLATKESTTPNLYALRVMRERLDLPDELSEAQEEREAAADYAADQRHDAMRDRDL